MLFIHILFSFLGSRFQAKLIKANCQFTDYTKLCLWYMMSVLVHDVAQPNLLPLEKDDHAPNNYSSLMIFSVLIFCVINAMPLYSAAYSALKCANITLINMLNSTVSLCMLNIYSSHITACCHKLEQYLISGNCFREIFLLSISVLALMINASLVEHPANHFHDIFFLNFNINCFSKIFNHNFAENLLLTYQCVS